MILTTRLVPTRMQVKGGDESEEYPMAFEFVKDISCTIKDGVKKNQESE